MQFNMNPSLFAQILIKVIKTKSYFALYNVYKFELHVNKADFLWLVKGS